MFTGYLQSMFCRVLDKGHVDLESNSLLQQFACESAGLSSHNLCSVLRLDWVSHWDSYTQSSILLSQKKVLGESYPYTLPIYTRQPYKMGNFHSHWLEC